MSESWVTGWAGAAASFSLAPRDGGDSTGPLARPGSAEPPRAPTPLVDPGTAMARGVTGPFQDRRPCPSLPGETQPHFGGRLVVGTRGPQARLLSVLPRSVGDSAACQAQDRPLHFICTAQLPQFLRSGRGWLGQSLAQPEARAGWSLSPPLPAGPRPPAPSPQRLAGGCFALKAAA